MLTALTGRMAQFVIALASVRVLTTLLTPDELGKVALILTTTAFFALFLVNPVGMFINRRLHSWLEAGVLRHYLHAYCGYLLAVAITACVVLALGMHLGFLQIGMQASTVAMLVAGSLVFNTVNQTLIPSLNMLGRVRPFVLLTLGTLLAGLGLSVLFIKLGEPTAQRWLAGILAGQAIFSLLAYAVFFDRRSSGSTPPLLDAKRLKSLFAFCWPAAVAVGLNWAQMQGYRFLIASENGLAELGLFTAGYGVAAAILSAMEQVLTTWFQPVFYREANSSNADVHASAWRHYAHIMLPLSLIGLLSLLAAAPDLVALMLGPAFQAALPYVLLGALAEWGRMLVGVFVLIAHLRLKTGLLIAPSALGAGIALFLIFWLLPRHGLYVAPLAVAAGGIAVSAYLHRSARSREHRLDLPWRQLAVAFASGAAALAITRGLRPHLDSLGILARPAALAMVVVLYAPLAWYYLAPARRLPRQQALP